MRRRRVVVGLVALAGLITGGVLHSAARSSLAIGSTAESGTASVRAVTATASPNIRAGRSIPSRAPLTPTTSVKPVVRGVAPAPVQAALAAAERASGADMAVAVFDDTDDNSWALHDSGRFDTASIVKLSILGATLVQAQQGRVLTSDTLEDLAGMIENSSNDDASELWAQAGYGTAVIGYDRSVGTTATSADPAGDWGLTVTSAADQVRIMRAIAYPSAVLTPASRAQAQALLNQVEADQRWGATGGVPAGVSVQVKNGWLPHGTGWVVNTVGRVQGQGRDYVVAILSQGSATEAAGISALEKVSAAVWATAGVS